MVVSTSVEYIINKDQYVDVKSDFYSTIKQQCMNIIKEHYSEIDIILRIARVPIIGHDQDILSMIIFNDINDIAEWDFQDNPIINMLRHKTAHYYTECIDIIKRLSSNKQSEIMSKLSSEHACKNFGHIVADIVKVSSKSPSQVITQGQLYDEIKNLFIMILSEKRFFRTGVVFSILKDKFFGMNTELLKYISRLDVIDLKPLFADITRLDDDIELYQKFEILFLRYNHTVDTVANLSEDINPEGFIDDISEFILFQLIRLLKDPSIYTRRKITRIFEQVLEPFKINISRVVARKTMYQLLISALILEARQPDPFGNVECQTLEELLTDILKKATALYDYKNDDVKKKDENHTLTIMQNVPTNGNVIAIIEIYLKRLSLYSYTYKNSYTFIDALNLLEKISGIKYPQSIRLLFELNSK